MLGIATPNNTHTFVIGNKEYVYTHCPLTAYVKAPAGDLSGRSNFSASNSTSPEKQLEDIADAFKWMRYWKNEDSENYTFGFIEDFENNVFYYDDDQALVIRREKNPERMAFFEKFEKVINW